MNVIHPGAFLTLHYRLAGPQGDVVNTFAGPPATLTLGTGSLAPALEQALLKGVPLHFMAEAVVLRSRWYWRDRRLAARQCYWRLAYLPLMRRWRVLISNQPLAGVEAPRSETTTARLFDTLDEALDAVQRVSHWRIMNAAHFEPGRRHTLRFHYLLQDEGLPRPLQAAERIEVQRDMDLTPEGAA